MDAQKLLDDVKLMLSRFKDLAHKAGVVNINLVVEVGETNGEVGSILCGVIKEAKIDHVIIGRSGISKIKRLFLGSVSRYIVDHVACDVTIVKTRHTRGIDD